MGKQDAVVEHQLGGGQLDRLAIAHYADALLGENREPIDHALCANLLEDADDEVADDHAHEEKVPPLARNGHKDRHPKVDEVKERKRVLGKDLAHGLGLDIGVGVGLPGGDALLDLGRREALNACCRHVVVGRCGVARHGLPSL